jgi:predicted 3-demethylubiquinone-9 3-methyltransferase (glyoxalase superfamily)
MPAITPCLWFDGQAEEAARFYVALFPNSRLTGTDAAPEGTPGGRDDVPLVVTFELDGVRFMGLNGGPQFTFDEAISFEIDCADQAEVDYYWEGLLAGGGQESQCGWLRDRFGVSWQVTPRRLSELMSDSDPARASRAMKAMLGMRKIDVAALEAAADATS